MDGVVANLLTVGSDAEFKTYSNENGYEDGSKIDLSALKKYEGFFKINFVAYDQNENFSETKSFYFAQDIKPPKVVENSIKECRKAADKTTLSFALENLDYSKAEIYTRKCDGTDTEWDESLTVSAERPEDFKNETNIDVIVTGLEPRTQYQHKVVFYDFSGNTTELEIAIDNTPPTWKSTVTESREAATSTKLKWANPGDKDFLES